MSNFVKTIEEKLLSAAIFEKIEGAEAAIALNYKLIPGSKIVLIAGPNASGKSVVGKVIEQVARLEKKSVRSSSMRNRTCGLLGQKMIFGDEGEESTGCNSVAATTVGFSSSIKDGNAVLILDEPDIGLSDEYAAALGDYIAQQMNQSHEQFEMLAVVSHSRLLFKSIIDAIEIPCSSIHVGDENTTFDDWLNQPFKKASIEELLNLKNKGFEKWSQIEKIIRENKKP